MAREYRREENTADVEATAGLSFKLKTPWWHLWHWGHSAAPCRPHVTLHYKGIGGEAARWERHLLKPPNTRANLVLTGKMLQSDNIMRRDEAPQALSLALHLWRESVSKRLSYREKLAFVSCRFRFSFFFYCVCLRHIYTLPLTHTTAEMKKRLNLSTRFSQIKQNSCWHVINSLIKCGHSIRLDYCEQLIWPNIYGSITL